MTEDEKIELHERLTRCETLQRSSLSQGGLILRELRRQSREARAHEAADEARFGDVEGRVQKLETHISWIKRIGMGVAAVLGWGHFK